MMPDENRINEILFYWLMIRLNKYTYTQLQTILEMFCSLTEDEDGVRVDLGTISELRQEFVQKRRWAPTDDETIWTLHKAGYGLRETARIMKKNHNYIFRKLHAVERDINRQFMTSALLEQDGQIALYKFMKAVKEFSL